MYVIFDNLTGRYYTGNGWNIILKLALKQTKPRADELAESMNMQVARGWASGEFVVLDYDIICDESKRTC